MEHSYYLKRAIVLAINSVEHHHGGPFGAVIVKDNQIIGEGYNQVTRLLNPTLHAEIMAIENACQTIQHFSLEGATIYSSCQPCPMCEAAIYWARIKQVFFAATKEDANTFCFDDRHIKDQLNCNPDERVIHFEKLEMPESLNPFILWSKKTNRIFY